MKKFKVPQDGEAIDEQDEDEEDFEDPTPALLASLLLMMTCPTCEGTGMTNKGRCRCRAFGFEVAVTVLRQEGLSS